MSSRRIVCLLFFLALSTAVSGCFGKSGGGGEASRSKKTAAAKRGKGKNGRVAHENIGDLSPEGSMDRDVKRLRELEIAQSKRIKSMRSDLDQGEEMIQREEAKLQDIQQRIRRYDNAIQGYEMAARSRPSREGYGEPAMIPAGQPADRQGRNARPASAGPASTGMYDAPLYAYDEPRRPSRSSGRARQQPAVHEGETLLYAPDMGGEPMYSAMAAPAYPQGGGMDGYGPAPAGRAPAGPAGNGQNRYSDDGYPPAPAERRPRPAAPRRDMDAVVLAEGADGQWGPPRSLFSSSSRSDTRFPDPDRIRTRTQGPEYPPEEVRPPRPAPTAPAPVSRAKPERAPAASAPTGGDGAGDEVFMPDMFLSGGR